MAMPLTRRRPNAIRALCLGAAASLVVWQSTLGAHLLEWLQQHAWLRSVEFRVSYWMTAFNMSNFLWPCGLGGNIPSMCRRPV